jgi:hypothetical protein
MARESISMFGGPILCPCGCGNEVASEEEFYSDECQIDLPGNEFQYGYRSWSPEERAEYDAMYDR